MPDFAYLDTAIMPDPNLDEDDVAFANEDLDDEAALGIVTADLARAESYRSSKQIIAGMDRADELFRAALKKRVWADGSQRSSLPSFTIMDAINKLMPPLMSTLWGSRELPCELSPIGKTSQDAAVAKSHLLRWAIKQSKLKEQVRLLLKTCLQYGFCIGQFGWKSEPKQIKRWKRDEQGKIVRDVQTTQIDQPFFKALNLRRVLYDSAADTQDLQESAGYIILQLKVTADDLDALRDVPGYKNIPSRDQLRQILASNNASQDSLAGEKQRFWSDLQAERDFVQTSSDPLATPLEIIEYWTADRVISVLNKVIVIRNEANEFGRKPFLSCAFIDVISSAWGFGCAKLLDGEQNFISSVRNMWVDSQSLNLTPMYQSPKGAGIGSQNIKVTPGRVLNSQAGPLVKLETGSITQEALASINDAEQRAFGLVGANGGSNLPSTAMRTAEGVSAFSQDITSRLEYFLDIFSELVFKPLIEAFLEMCALHLDEAQINDILSEKDGKAYSGDILDVYNATLSVTVNAGSKLSQRIAATQLVPQVIALVTNAAVQQALVVQNKKFDFTALLEQTLPLMGLELDALITDMTPEDTQRAQQMNPQVQKGMMDQQLEAQKQQNVLSTVDAKATANLAGKLIVTAAKDHQIDPAASASAMLTGNAQSVDEMQQMPPAMPPGTS